jgi:regulator of sirC expression with transglutaminase-like and TPR domain
MSHPHARRHLVELVRRGGEIPLGEAALWIAADDLPGVDPGVYLARLEHLAARVRQGCPEAAGDSAGQCAALSYVLFHEERFVGNTRDYHDPRNSYLNEVLDRRTGLPITLSVVFLEVARRVGLEAHGLNFPGHFLVAVRQAGGVVVLDPFHRGRVLDAEELRERWQRTTGRPAPRVAKLLAPAEGLTVILRLLNNLKLVYLQRSELEQAAATVEKMALVDPLSADHQRDLGTLYVAARAYSKAVDAFERYLNLAPSAPDADEVRKHLRAANEMIARWN